jgi:hypothetical protein
MSDMAVSCKRQKLLTLHKHMHSPTVFGGVRVTHLFSFLFCVAFAFLRPVSLVCPKVANVSGLSILDLPFGFLWRLFI